MKKGKWMLAAACMMLVGIYTTGVAFAYMTDYEVKTNKVAVSYNDSNITEEFPDPTPVIPGQEQTYTKKVTVTNKESVPCFIRVSIDYSSSDIGNHVTLQQLNTKDWEYVGKSDNQKLGGYYYYKEPVASGQSTNALIDGITIGKEADCTDADEFTVIVYEESVQQTGTNTYLEEWNSFIREQEG